MSCKEQLLVLAVCFGFIAYMPAHGAVRGKAAVYVGGTNTGIPERTEGKLDLAGEDEVRFVSQKGEIAIPYKQITSLEYGQKAGRRLGVALAVSPIALFSKKRKHFLTIGYSDVKGTRQGVVLELAKGTIHPTVSALESRSGKTLEFESEEGKKHFEKGAK